MDMKFSLQISAFLFHRVRPQIVQNGHCIPTRTPTRMTMGDTRWTKWTTPLL
jgi:hypothetical protein